MKETLQLSVAYSFSPGLIGKLARFPAVKEVYGKMALDVIGGGRSAYTLRPVSFGRVKSAVAEAHQAGLEFNYLLNGATLGGLEQSRAGQKKIHALLRRLQEIKVNTLTVASPYLLRLVKAQYPAFKIRVSAFAMVDSADKAGQWEKAGADTICVSAIACNRDFRTLKAIRRAVSCNLELIANAGCLLNCAQELAHMHLLTQSSTKGNSLNGFCLDHCFLHCSAARLRDPVNFIRSTWIRPEDLSVYEDLGYHHFKIVERSCPDDLLLRRVEAYALRAFNGNLLEIAGPVAQVTKAHGASFLQRLRLLAPMLRPWRSHWRTLLLMKRYAEAVMAPVYSQSAPDVRIDNSALDGFLKGLLDKECSGADCRACGYCGGFAERAVTINPEYGRATLSMASALEKDLYQGAL